MSTIDNAKKSMGWVHQHARPACGNCDKVVVDDARRFSYPELRCQPGGFFTLRYAICDKYEPMKLTDGSVPK